jgi:Cu(I)/Ag(I) efflux system membrane fusion protein
MSSRFLQPQLLGVLIVGVSLGASLSLGLSKYLTASTHKSLTQMPTSPKALYWYDPMQPAQHFDKPGKSPFMDMELVAKYADSGSAMNTLLVDSAQVQNLGMRKTKVMRLPLRSQHDFPGTLRFNERNQAVIQLRAGGFVEKAWPLAPGDHVTAGQPIATFYIPQWLDSQNELLAS